MEVEKATVTDILGGNKKAFIIPVYQRNYSWTKKEAKKLFEDVQNFSNYENLENYFLGTIVYKTDKTALNYSLNTLIDGQQRLTTLSLLLKAISKTLSDLNVDDVNEIQSSFLENKKSAKKDLGYIVRLKPNSKDATTYNQIMENQDVTDTASLMYQNYKYFLEQLEGKSDEAESLFSNIENTLLVYISLDDKDDPQLIFETINSTGKNLEFSDLIRNYILTKESPEKQEEYYEKYWKSLEAVLGKSLESFIRTYLIMQRNSVFQKKDTYLTFTNFWIDKRDNVDEALTEMLDFAHIYNKIEAGYSDVPYLNEVFEIFHQLDYSLTYPFIMRMVHAYEIDKAITQADLHDTVSLIASYVIRKTMTRVNLTGTFATFMVKLYDEVKNSSNIKLAVASKLLSQTGRMKYTTDVDLAAALKTADIYNTRYKMFLFRTLEDRESKEKNVWDNISLDHIMPQNMDDEWKKRLSNVSDEVFQAYLHRFGNLALTGYNSEKSNHVKDIYTDSKFKINKGIDVNNWNIDLIDERTDTLTKKLIDIFPYPEIDTSEYEVNDVREDDRMDMTDFSVEELDAINPKSFLLTLKGEKYLSPSISTWQEFATELKKSLLEANVANEVVDLINDDATDEIVIRSVKDMLDNIVEDLHVAVSE
ncbi:DUF262 domain-containing protein [Weissella cibaria]|uniref:DUF262 domain-containing protein n=1 Tax=Weissella cibaria TaxID=137591 RepID=UPI001C1FF46D|nr:DUF262 domain-containing protein [Weissella cibaria]MBU7562365.1 DUF262 domain-containing protein [Weissella cibaria]